MRLYIEPPIRTSSPSPSTNMFKLSRDEEENIYSQFPHLRGLTENELLAQIIDSREDYKPSSSSSSNIQNNFSSNNPYRNLSLNNTQQALPHENLEEHNNYYINPNNSDDSIVLNNYTARNRNPLFQDTHSILSISSLSSLNSNNSSSVRNQLDTNPQLVHEQALNRINEYSSIGNYLIATPTKKEKTIPEQIIEKLDGDFHNLFKNKILKEYSPQIVMEYLPKVFLQQLLAHYFNAWIELKSNPLKYLGDKDWEHHLVNGDNAPIEWKIIDKLNEKEIKNFINFFYFLGLGHSMNINKGLKNFFKFKFKVEEKKLEIRNNFINEITNIIHTMNYNNDLFEQSKSIINDCTNSCTDNVLRGYVSITLLFDVYADIKSGIPMKIFNGFKNMGIQQIIVNTALEVSEEIGKKQENKGKTTDQIEDFLKIILRIFPHFKVDTHIANKEHAMMFPDIVSVNKVQIKNAIEIIKQKITPANIAKYLETNNEEINYNYLWHEFLKQSTFKTELTNLDESIENFKNARDNLTEDNYHEYSKLKDELEAKKLDIIIPIFQKFGIDLNNL